MKMKIKFNGDDSSSFDCVELSGSATNEGLADAFYTVIRAADCNVDWVIAYMLTCYADGSDKLKEAIKTFEGTYEDEVSNSDQ